VSESPLILIVDDSRSDALLLSRSLEKAGYGTLTAHSGAEAVQLARDRVPDLILLDMTMPAMDGVATCAELKRDAATESIPIVFVTAHSDGDHVVKAFSAGGSDYVTKPIRIDEILARMSVQLRLREAERGLLERNTQLETLAAQLAEMNETLCRQSRMDGLTNLLNRRAFDEAAYVEHDRAQRYGRPYCLLMIDVDYFKAFNDSLGHPAGDRCLQQIADALARACRTTDVVARYGGEEFVVLAPETSSDGGARLAERIRLSVWGLSIRHPGSPAGRCTVSIGVAGSQEGDLQQVLLAADSFLYRAKHGGRNLVFSRQTAVLVPLRPDRPTEDSVRQAGPDANDKHAPLILVVEDNRANRVVYRRSLESEGYRIEEAEHGEAALAAIASEPPDLILMDVMMPVMDGIECTRRLKADPEHRDIPVIIVSARDDPGSVLAGLDAGAEEYLTKPVRSTELIARVRSMIRLTSERRDLLRSYALRAEQIRFLTLLVDFCRQVGDASSVNDVLDHLITTVSEITCSRRVSVMLPDAERRSLMVAREIGMDDPSAENAIVPIGEGIAGQVFVTREAIVVNGAMPTRDERDPSRPGAPGSAGDGAQAQPYVSVPLMVTPIGTAAQIVGVLNVTDRVGRRPFEDSELEYVELVGGIAASALHMIRNRHARDVARDLIINALARLAEHRDSDTGQHVERVTQYSCILAEALRRKGQFTDTIDDAFVHNLTLAVPLHDIGKVAIPDRILLKPGKLSLDEMQIMRTHVDIGAQTLQPVLADVPDADSLRMALDIIRGHHEWYDGSGYPLGLTADAIPLPARIVALADVYDALTRDRVYKRAVAVEEAARMIVEASGTQFDPAIVEAFVASKDAFRDLAARMADGASAPSVDLERPSQQVESLKGLEPVAVI